jgi:hypothetical protein
MGGGGILCTLWNWELNQQRGPKHSGVIYLSDPHNLIWVKFEGRERHVEVDLYLFAIFSKLHILCGCGLYSQKITKNYILYIIHCFCLLCNLFTYLPVCIKLWINIFSTHKIHNHNLMNWVILNTEQQIFFIVLCIIVIHKEPVNKGWHFLFPRPPPPVSPNVGAL